MLNKGASEPPAFAETYPQLLHPPVRPHTPYHWTRVRDSWEAVFASTGKHEHGRDRPYDELAIYRRHHRHHFVQEILAEVVFLIA